MLVLGIRELVPDLLSEVLAEQGALLASLEDRLRDEVTSVL